MDGYQIMKDILSLADSTPLHPVDIAPIIERYTNGLDVENQRLIRAKILGSLRELQSNNEIFLFEPGYSITTTQAGQFMNSSMKVKSTYDRVKRLEEKTAPAHAPNIHIGGDVIGSQVGNHSLENARINPTIQITNPTPRKNANTRSLIEICSWVAGIGAFLLAVYELIIKRFL